MLATHWFAYPETKLANPLTTNTATIANVPVTSTDYFPTFLRARGVVEVRGRTRLAGLVVPPPEAALRVVDVDLPGFAKKVLKPTNTMHQNDEWHEVGDGSWEGVFGVQVAGGDLWLGEARVLRKLGRGAEAAPKIAAMAKRGWGRGSACAAMSAGCPCSVSAAPAACRVCRSRRASHRRDRAPTYCW